jgi:hypothetical protein
MNEFCRLSCWAAELCVLFQGKDVIFKCLTIKCTLKYVMCKIEVMQKEGILVRQEFFSYFLKVKNIVFVKLISFSVLQRAANTDHESRLLFLAIHHNLILFWKCNLIHKNATIYLPILHFSSQAL